MLRGERWGVLLLAWSYALLILSHMPTTLCFSLVPPLYALWFASPATRIRNVVRTSLAMVLGIGLAAAFLIPALIDQRHLNMGAHHSGWFDYHRWWLFQIQPWFDARMRLLLLMLTTLAFCAWALWAYSRYTPRPYSRWAWFCGSVLVASVFMTSQLSEPVWRIVKPLSALQFPTRFLQVTIVMIGGLAAVCWPALRRGLPRAGAAVLLLPWIVSLLWAMPMAYWRWRPIPPGQEEFYRNMRMGQTKTLENSTEYFAFWPKGTRSVELGHDPLLFETFLRQYPPRKLQFVPAPPTNEAKASVENWRPRHITLSVQTPVAARLRLHHFYYPGWRAYVESTPTVLEVRKGLVEGFIELDVPSGNHRLHLKLDREGPERAGLWISAAAFVLALLLTGYTLMRGRARTSAPVH
jgi:hypothetical protein